MTYLHPADPNHHTTSIVRWVLVAVMTTASVCEGAANLVVVHPDGSGDYPNIQTAIDAVEPDSTILLSSGIFRGPGNRDLNLRGKEITIQSELDNPQSCILDLEGQESDRHRGFRFESGEGPSTIIRGLTKGTDGPGSAVPYCASTPTHRSKTAGSSITIRKVKVALPTVLTRARASLGASSGGTHPVPQVPPSCPMDPAA